MNTMCGHYFMSQIIEYYDRKCVACVGERCKEVLVWLESTLADTATLHRVP